MKSHPALKIILLLLAIMQFVAPQLHNLTGFGINFITAQNAVKNPLVPLAYAFSIWGVIFSCCLLHAILQFNRHYNRKAIFKNTKSSLALSLFLSMTWMIGSQIPLSNTVLAIILILLFASIIRCYFILNNITHDYSIIDYVATMLPISLFAGWATLAAFLNISISIQTDTTLFTILNPSTICISLLIVALVSATVIIIKSNLNRAYCLTIIWGVCAITLANIYREFNLAMLIASLIALFIALLLLIRSLT